MKLAFKLLEDAGIPQERAKPEGMDRGREGLMHYCDYSSLAVISACRHCPQGPQEHSQGTLLHLWQVQVSFPATTATPTTQGDISAV